MEGPVPQPDTINKLKFAGNAAFAMLAGMQLDVFTPLKGGSMTAEDVAKAIAASPARLRLLLYALVAAELLTEKDGRFSNTPESDQFLVKGSPSYMATHTRSCPIAGSRFFRELPNLFAVEFRSPWSISLTRHSRNWKHSFEESTRSRLRRAITS